MAIVNYHYEIYLPTSYNMKQTMEISDNESPLTVAYTKDNNGNWLLQKH